MISQVICYRHLLLLLLLLLVICYNQGQAETGLTYSFSEGQAVIGPTCGENFFPLVCFLMVQGNMAIGKSTYPSS